jgi:hypothetical protein
MQCAFLLHLPQPKSAWITKAGRLGMHKVYILFFSQLTTKGDWDGETTLSQGQRE